MNADDQPPTIFAERRDDEEDLERVTEDELDERLGELWPQLTAVEMRQIVEDDRDTPKWVSDLHPSVQDVLYDEARHELRMQKREAERHSQDGHPEHGDDWHTTQIPSKNGGFKRAVTEDDTMNE